MMIEEDNKTLWCGNLAEQVTEDLLYELFLQAGPLDKVRIPRDRDGRQKNFAFITYCHDVSVPYAMNLFRGTALFNRTLSLQCRARMASLPPPIRSTSVDQSFDFLARTNVKHQFADMTQSMGNDDYTLVEQPRQFHGGDLVMASLQGNWSHRHHPYERRHGSRDNGRDNNMDRDNRHKHGNWRDRRNQQNSGHYNNRSHHRRRE